MPSRHSHAACKKLIAFGLLTALIGLSGCDVLGTTTKIKVTATVDLNGKLYSGSAVQEYNCREGGGIMGSMNVGGCTVKGEAVVVDLKERGYLFLIFKGPHGDVSSLAYAMLHAKDKMWWKRSWTLTPIEMPMMVTFKDRNDPLTVRQVDARHTHVYFGRKATLKSIKVGYDIGSITRGKVEQALPWMKAIKGKSVAIDGTSGWSRVELSNQLSPIDFISNNQSCFPAQCEAIAVWKFFKSHKGEFRKPLMQRLEEAVPAQVQPRPGLIDR